MKVTAIVPCYNVEKYCRNVIEKTLDHCSFIVLIDDGSTDQTNKILQELQSSNSQKIHLITFPQNQGKGIALLEGIKYALSDTSFDALVTIDSDGQHLPSEIPKLVSCIQEGSSLVIGSRDFTKIPFRRRL
ncbi:MAG: glycosyltransferase family 2 protein, partial [Chlamydiota bacterium]